MAARSATPNSGGEGCSSAASPAATLSRAGSATSLRSSRASKRQLNGSQATLAGGPADLTCPVCLELLEEAHITRCGHTFCFRCISKSLDTAGFRCPKCGATVAGMEQVFPNYAVNELVAKHRQQTEVPNDLRDLVAAESSRMTLPDLNAVLEMLTQRKHMLEAETSAAQNRLLHEFLKHLLSQREEQLTRLSREVSLIKRDIAHVEGILQNTDAPDEAVDCPLVAARRKRMHSHFDDFVHCYFSTRARELMFGEDSVTKRSSSQQSMEEEGLEKFRENLVKFSRYNSLRPIATLNYSSGAAFNSSTIVSSIEFDKDDELFAIAGVTKRIKVFDYGAVARDAVDIHYPCVEMVSSSKISCVSWNAYHKATLVSSDYEGAVTVWDVATGNRSKVFQEHEKRCWSVDFNQVDTRLIASGSDDSRVKLWSLNVEHSVASLEAKANVCCVKFNPRSSCHLAFGSADHCVHYYDLRATREPLAMFKGHRKAVSYVKFLGGEELVSASTDSNLRLWNLSKPHCLRSFTGHVNEKNFVGLATDGTDYVACGSENNALYVYYKGLSKQLFSFRFDAGRSVLGSSGSGKDSGADEASEFVSAVCWKRRCNVVLAANSQGIIKVLELV